MSRIDNKFVVVAAIVLGTVCLVGLAGVAFFGRRSVESRLEAEHSRADALAARRAELEQRAAVKKPEPGRWQLLADADVSGTLQVVQAAADAAGVVCGSLKATQSNSPGRQSFTLSGHGTPDQLCTFLAGLEQHVRLVVVETGKVVPFSGEEIGFDLGLSTFHTGGAR